MASGRRASETGPAVMPLPEHTVLAPPMSTSVTPRLSPGSNRTEVPAGMASRRPYARSRSKRSAALASMK